MRTVRDTHVKLSACGSTYRWRYVLARARPFALLARLVLLAVLLPVRITEAQPDPLNEIWRWARYGTESGLPSGHVLDLVETSNGVSWARTEARLAWYDPYQWHPVGIEEEAALRLPTRIVPDCQGGILAVAGQRLYRVDQQGFSRLPIGEEASRLTVRDVVPLGDEELLVLTSDRLYRHHPGGLDPFPTPAGMAPEEIAKSLFGVFAPEATTASFQIAPPLYRHPLFLATVLLWLLSMSALGLFYWRRHRRIEERFSKVFHASPMAIAIASLDEGRLLEVNESFEKFFGYARNEVIGKTTRELNLWHDPDRHTLLIARIQQGEVLHNIELKFVTKSGAVRNIQGSVELVKLGGRRRLLWMGIDVTERKRAEEALRLSQTRLEAAQARAKMGSWEYYPETRAGYWSKEMFHIYGLDPASDYPSMSTFLELIHPEDRQRVQTSQMQSLYTLEPISIDYRTNPARGPERHLSATVLTVKDPEGHPIYLAGTVMDITERKEAEALREQLIAELETKNAELERFTYTVSHDLKSPLVTIRGFVGLLEQDAAAGNTDQMKRDIAHINHATDKMHRLLGELLELSRIGRQMNPPEAVALSELAQEAATLVAGRLVARGVEVDIEEEMPVIYGDRLRLLEVYQNLIDNAVKFMGDQRAPRLEIGARQNGSEVECWVQDNGLGIAAVYHEKIFGLFERLEAEGEGTGIGLALVKRIVEVHGGRIWVESEGRGQGSTFYFTLPPKEP